MADTQQTLGLIVQAQEYRGDIVRQTNRRVTLLKMIRIVPGAGPNVAWVPQASGHIAENHSEGATATNFGSDAQAGAVLGWGQYRSPFHVTKLAQDSAGSSNTPQGNKALWKKNMIDASSTLADKVEKECFVGPGTGTTIAGLDVAIGDDTNTYATVVRGSNAYFKPMVVDPGADTAISFQLVRRDLAAIQKNGGESPDFCVCGLSTFAAVAGLFDPNRRWNVVNTARGKVNLDAGYEGVEIDGCMFVKAKDATEGSLYYCNSRYMELQYLPDTTYPEYVYDMVQADDGYGSVPFGFHYEMLAKVGPADRAEILAQCQLKIERPNAFGVRKHVQYAA